MCQFYSRQVLLNCPVNTSNCIYNTYSFSVDSLTNIAVSDGCGLSVKAYKKIEIARDSTITANFVNLTCTSKLIMSGTLTTSGKGPLEGPGSGEGTGRGGSYGGSGGDPSCTPGQYYSNYLSQIGSVDVKQDWPAEYDYAKDSVDPVYPTMGSGGGQGGVNTTTGEMLHGGRGGGMINLVAPLIELFNGHLFCEGAKSVVADLGSGSGGSISITADRIDVSIQKAVVMSVRGGEGERDQHIAAGGGGRISFHVSIFLFAWVVKL